MRILGAEPAGLAPVAHKGLVGVANLFALDDDLAAWLVEIEFFEGHGSRRLMQETPWLAMPHWICVIVVSHAVPRFVHLSMITPKSGACFALIGRFRVLTSTFAAAVSQ